LFAQNKQASSKTKIKRADKLENKTKEKKKKIEKK
jgi:hypothetical protein